MNNKKEIQQKNLCVNSKEQERKQEGETRNICEGESFYFRFKHFRRLVYFFSGWKFSSSSLLKILLGFRA